MSPRARHHGVRKLCGCGQRQWSKCSHSWFFNFKPKGGPHHRFCLDVELGRRLDGKTEAENAATQIRAAILAGTFERAADRLARLRREEDAQRAAAGSATDVSVVTLDQFVITYITRGPQASGKASWKDDEYLLTTVRNHRTVSGRRLGDYALSAITEDEIEAFHAARRAAGRAASTLNHLVQVLKAAFRWAVRKGYLPRSPISDESALKRSKMAKRTRRLPSADEAALLAVASPRLQLLITGALETGMRLGELIDLTWRDVTLVDGVGVITVRGETAKDADVRLIPISARLAAFLEMAKTDTAGHDYPAEKFVFGELGERVGSLKKAWETAVLKANGIKPVWIGGKLSEECRADLRRIDLHFHDLRREAGSRWHEGGFQLHEVRDLLGHANVSQTDTYLSAKIAGLRESMRRFDAARCKPVAKETSAEHRPPGNESSGEVQKDLLH